MILSCAVVYLGLALWFWHHQLLPGDAMSRLANGYYVFYSRDPHLAAIGFVWNPLPSLILLPFLPLTHLFPALTQQALLAPLVSAVLMTATVAVAHDVLRRTGLRRVPRLLLTVAFAAHPMTLLYAGNGMSEACFLLCLLLAVRSFHMWLAEGRVELLVPLGLALALGYGARYEALAPAAAVTVVVTLVTYLGTTIHRISRGPDSPARGPDSGAPGASRARRWSLARADAVIVGLPPFLAFVLWAAASKIIVDQWFATFSSQYGNSTQVDTAASDISSVTGADLPSRTVYWLQQLIGLSPVALLLTAIALVIAWRRRDLRVMAPITVLGSVLAFDALAFLSGTSFGWLRFNITVIPLGVLVAGHLIAWALPPAPLPAGAPAIAAPGTPASPSPGLPGADPSGLPGGPSPSVPGGGPSGLPGSASPNVPGGASPRLPGAGSPGRPGADFGGFAGSGSGVVRRALAVAVIVAVFAAVPGTLAVLSRSTLAREEAEWVTDSGSERRRELTQIDARVAADLDALDLPDGAVITDAAYAFGVVLSSDRPRQFVITPDRDFTPALTDPATHHVQYLLLSADGSADAVRIARYGPDPTAVPETGVRTWRDANGGLQWTLVPVP
ncbi:hypothetical protein [Actinoplanes awajinensis]|uniref:Glycosyltransferase RgtA/B/C/D-like domain-containing protein n=1 Tax=Actinoplanes awajinensis subsp. mycoplanecinus TaxID=135947 RepID=A0A101JCH5_9ACTN|nr:hypothetical protein [Actinoplanes awajinensis]KUL24260.1 hypothetical protein ADL15_43800 [Actinoplanes awajinensis subsp. mycoplanecinus]